MKLKSASSLILATVMHTISFEDLRNRTGGTNGAGDGNRTHGIPLGKLAFYFHEIQNSLKFSRLQIIAIISMSYDPRIPRTDLHGTHPLSRFPTFMDSMKFMRASQ